MAKVKEVYARMGTSIEVNNAWYKFEFALTVEVEPGDDVETVKSRAWATCDDEITRQIEEVMPKEEDYRTRNKS